MTVQIEASKALIFAAGCLAAYFVFKYTRRSGPGRYGDLVGAIAAGAAVIAVLAFLVVPQEAVGDVPVPAPTPSSNDPGRS